jgi:hypothetical protein
VRNSMAKALSQSQRYLFDTLGFVVLRGALSAAELELVNRGIDKNANQFFQREGALRNSAAGSSGRIDCGSFLSWSAEDGGDVFRSLLCHPVIAPVLDELCGVGHRLDHKPILFRQPNGCEGFDLHGGAVSKTGVYDYPISYHCHAGNIVCNLINVAVQFTASPRGAGGFVVVPGSHKSNFPNPPPEELQAIADTYGYQPECNAGDVVLFAEACLHGAAVRAAPQERRVALIRFAPATCAFARGYLDGHPQFYDYLTDAQKAVVAPPYHLQLDRLIPADNGGHRVANPRRQDKKDFDKTVLSSEYY